MAVVRGTGVAFSAALVVMTLAGVVAMAAGEEQPSRFPIEGRVQFPSRHNNNAGNAKPYVMLNGGQYVTHLKEDGTFQFQDLPPGAHLLEVVSVDFVFRPIRVDISLKHNGKVKAKYADGSKNALAYPLVLAPERYAQYYEIREPFNVMQLISNPMVFMALITVVMLLILPRMMAGLEPEQLKQMQQAQGNPVKLFKQALADAEQESQSSGSSRSKQH